MAYSNVILKFWGWDYFLLFKYNAGLPFHYRILGIRILPSFSFITRCGVCVCGGVGGICYQERIWKSGKSSLSLLYQICFLKFVSITIQLNKYLLCVKYYVK